MGVNPLEDFRKKLIEEAKRVTKTGRLTDTDCCALRGLFEKAEASTINHLRSVSGGEISIALEKVIAIP